MILPTLLLVALAAVADSAGGVPADTVLVLPEVRVERERLPAGGRRRLPTASVTELEPGASGRAVETLAELLGEAPGVRVQQYGGLGAFSTVSLRGAPAGQVAIYLDGAPLTSAAHGVVSLGDLPATAIERVEVYRGLSPLGLGPAAPGGAVNLVSASSPGLRSVRIAGGAFGTWEGRASAGARRGPLQGFAHLGHQRSQGNFRYPDDNGTPFDPGDDSLSTRVNNRFTATTLLASLTWHPAPGWKLGARQDLLVKDQGVPGLGAVPARHTRLDLARGTSRLTAWRRGGGAVPSVGIGGGLARERTRFRDPGAELGLGRHDTDDHTGSDDGTLELEWSGLPGGTTLTTIGAIRREWARSSDRADGYPDPPGSRRTTLGGGAVLQWRPAAERLVIHAGYRRDRLRDRIHWVEAGGLARSREVGRPLAAPQLGARVEGPGGLEVRANWTAAGRAPDFLELFGNQGSVLGNPELGPERSRHWDAGLTWSGALAHGLTAALDLAHFASRSEDLVVYVRHSQSSVRAENISRATVAGEEISLRLGDRSGRALSAGLTRMTSRDRGPVPFWSGRRLPLRPALAGFTRLDWRRGRLRAVADLQYLGDDYLDRANLQRVPDRLLVGSSLTFTPHHGGWRLALEGKNLGNDRVADVGGFPLPGRALFAACELRLGADQTRLP